MYKCYDCIVTLVQHRCLRYLTMRMHATLLAVMCVELIEIHDFIVDNAAAVAQAAIQRAHKQKHQVGLQWGQCGTLCIWLFT